MNVGVSFVFVTLIIDDFSVAPSLPSFAIIVTILSPTSAFKGVPDNIPVPAGAPVKGSLGVNVNQLDDGSVVAFNVKVDNELKVNSTGTRDERFSQFGTLENITFSELPSSKFDYIDTTIYVMGATSNSRLQIPIRIIRYTGA